MATADKKFIHPEVFVRVGSAATGLSLLQDVNTAAQIDNAKYFLISYYNWYHLVAEGILLLNVRVMS